MTDTVSVYYTIREAAEKLNRRPATLRAWERDGKLPPELRPIRNDRGWRCYTDAQVLGLARWIEENDMRPGKGLPWYNPTPEQIRAHLAGQRRPRKEAKKIVA